MEVDTDVVVVGAGVSGLSAAKLLTLRGLKVVVLEGRGRVGGRTFTHRDSLCGGYVDLGGAYVGPTQRRVGRMARELGLKFYKIEENDEYKNVFHDNGRVLEYSGSVLPPVYNPIKILDLNHVMRTIDRMSRTISAREPWTSPDAQWLDTMTVSEFLNKTCWTNYSNIIVSLLVRALLCVEPYNISMLSFLWYISAGQGLKRMLSIRQGAQERKFVGGSMQLCEKMAEKLTIKLNSRVVRIVQSDSTVALHTSNSDVIRSKYVISAVPLALLNRITFEPPLPVSKFQLSQRIPMGQVLKTIVYYDKSYWKEKGLSGRFLSFSGPLVHGLDDTKPDGSAPALVSYIRGRKAIELSSLTQEERKEMICKQYVEMFRCPELGHPKHYIEMNWMAEEFSGGCYVGTFPPGVITNFNISIREPFRRVFFGGTECATYWAGYMEGAVESGYRAAREVLMDERGIDPEEIWKEEPPVDDFQEIPFDETLMERILPSPGTFLVLSGLGFFIGLGFMFNRFNRA